MNAPALNTPDERPAAGSYPAHLAATSRLVDGTEFIIRPIHPDDEALERAFVCGLSRDSAYNRLLSCRKLSAQEIRQLTHIDYEREMAFVAVRGAGVQADLLGVARYVKNADGAEFALVVADAWQHRGLGTQLLGALLRYARSAGIARLYGVTLASNQAMLGLARKLGLRLQADAHDATLRWAAKDLAAMPQPLHPVAGHLGAAANDASLRSG